MVLACLGSGYYDEYEACWRGPRAINDFSKLQYRENGIDGSDDNQERPPDRQSPADGQLVQQLLRWQTVDKLEE